MKKNKIIGMFVRNNIGKTLPSILTLTTFLLILNILLGILFSTTGVLSRSVTNNSYVRFMEVLNNGDFKKSSQMVSKISALPEVDECFPDVSHPIMIETENSDQFELYTALGIPKGLLSEFGLSSDTDQYIFLPRKDSDKFKKGSVVKFEETFYNKNARPGESSYELKELKYTVSGYYDDMNWDLFPENVVLMDQMTTDRIAVGGTSDGIMAADRIIVHVADVSDMKTVEENIREMYPDTDIRYDLKHTGELPGYSKLIIAVSGTILIVLLVFCIFNINGNVKQILNSRRRDIGLLSLFGVDSGDITSIFVSEYFISGLISFVLAIAVTAVLFILLKVFGGIDMLTGYMHIYIIADALLAVLIFVLISAIQVKKALKKINKAKLFKEVLK
jgi:ABC-type antimicrobial peptide transport system permease subunit